MSHQPHRPLPPHVGYPQPCPCPAAPECLLNAACPAFPEWAEVQDSAPNTGGQLPAPCNAEPTASLLASAIAGSSEARDIVMTAELTVEYLRRRPPPTLNRPPADSRQRLPEPPPAAAIKP